jgi:hypothetical protein
MDYQLALSAAVGCGAGFGRAVEWRVGTPLRLELLPADLVRRPPLLVAVDGHDGERAVLVLGVRPVVTEDVSVRVHVELPLGIAALIQFEPMRRISPVLPGGVIPFACPLEVPHAVVPVKKTEQPSSAAAGPSEL